MIIDNFNVKSASYNKDYLDLPFGSYAFLNIVHGNEEREGSGNSWQNMVEVVVVMEKIAKMTLGWMTSGSICVYECWFSVKSANDRCFESYFCKSHPISLQMYILRPFL